MVYAINPNIRHSMIGEDVIMLHVAHGRYSALPRHFVPSFIRALEGDPLSAEDQQILAPLIDGEILEIGKPSPAPHPQRCPAATYLLDETSRSPAPFSLFAACYRRINAQRQLRTEPFERIVSDLEAAKAQAGRAGSAKAAGRIAGSFRNSFRIIARTDNCLSTSIGLAKSLWRHQVPASLVIGVRTGPFAAHSWVQLETALVCDDLEAIAPYKPILVV